MERQPLGRRGLGRQQLGRTRVRQRALTRGQAFADGDANNRVGEVELVVIGEDRRGAQRVPERGCAVELEARERGDVPQRRSGSQNRERSDECLAAGGKAGQPPREQTPDALGPELGDPCRGRIIGLAGLGGDRFRERAQEERVAAGRLVAGSTDALAGGRADRSPNQLGGGRSAERRRTERLAGCLCDNFL